MTGGATAWAEGSRGRSAGSGCAGPGPGRADPAGGSLAGCSILVAVPSAGFLMPLFLLLLIQALSVSAAERSYEGKVCGPWEALCPFPLFPLPPALVVPR